MAEIEKILFPFDLTENSSKILPYVVSLAEKYNSLICLLHVSELHGWGGHYIPHPSLGVLQKEAVQAAEKAMDRICEELAEGGQSLPDCQKIVISGDPATEILKTIESEDIDLVIMGTHGHKGMEHTIFGSVAENVVKKSPVPVMTVNPYKVK